MSHVAIFALLCSTLVSAASAQAQEARWLYPAVVTVEALDYHSTNLALSRPSLVEGNGVMAKCVSSQPCFIGVKVAMTTGLLLYVEKVARPMHPKLAFWLQVGIIAGQGYIAVHNYQLANRHR